MAHGYSRTTGKASVCISTSGPGATNFVTCLADAKMDRTKGRPLPAGLVSPAAAFWFGLSLIAVGFVELGLGNNWLTAVTNLSTNSS